MTGLSFADVRAQLQALADSGTATLASITDIVRQTNIEPPAGATVVLYSGPFGDTGSSAVANAIASGVNQASGTTTLATIGMTGFEGAVAESQELENALRAAGFEPGSPEFLDAINGSDPTQVPPGSPNYIDARDSIWGAASDSYVNSASGNVVTITANASPIRIFGEVELDALLTNPDVTSIDGISVDALNAQLDRLVDSGLTRSEALISLSNGISDKSLSNTLTSVSTEVGPNGRIVDIAVEAEFFESTGSPDIDAIQANGTNVTALADQLDDGDFNISLSRLANSAEFLRGLQATGEYLGPLGDVLEIALVTSAVNAAIDAGDFQEAQDVIIQFVAEFGGGAAAGAGAGLFAEIFLANAVTGGGVGAAISLLVLGVGAGYLGSEQAGDLASFFLTGNDGIEFINERLDGLQDLIASISPDQSAEFGFIVNGVGAGGGLVEEVTIFFRPFDTKLEKHFTFRGTDQDIGDVSLRLFELVDGSFSTLLRDIFSSVGIDVNDFALEFGIDRVLDNPEALNEVLTDQPGEAVEAVLSNALEDIFERLTPEERQQFEEDGSLPARVEAELRNEVVSADEENSEELVIDLSNSVITNTTNVGGVDVVRVTGPDGLISIDVNISGTTISLGQIGSIFGTHIGRLISPDDPFAQIAGGTLLGAAGSVLFETGGLLANGQALDVSLSTVLADLDTTIQTNTVSALSGFLFAELLAELGVEGVAAQALSTTAGTAITGIANNIIVGQDSFGEAISNIANIDSLGQIAEGAFSSFGSFFGSALANEIINIDSPEELAAASLGGAVGSYVAGQGLGAYFSGFGLLGNFVTAGFGAFVGTIAFDFAVDVIMGTPESGRSIIYDPATGDFVLGGIFSNDGADENLPDDLAQIALPLLNSITNALEAGGVEILNPEFVNRGAFGQRGSEIAFYTDGENSETITSSDGLEVINAGLQASFSGLELAGGNIYLRRAFYRYLEEAEDAGSFDGNELFAALAVAQDYAVYQQNSEIIDAVSALNPNSVFAAGFIITALQAQELRLDEAFASDFFGGLGGYIDSLRLNFGDVAFDDISVDITDNDSDGAFDDLQISFSAEGLEALTFNDFAETFGFGSFEAVDATTTGTIASDVLILSEAAGAASLSDSPDAVTSNNDSVLSDTGLSLLSDDIFIGNSFANTLDGGIGADFLDGKGGNDTIRGGAGDDIIIGRAGNDVLNGGGDDDYLSGGAGNDDLNGGTGNDTLEGSSIGERDTLDGSAGTDTASYELSSEGVFVDLTSDRFDPTTSDVLIEIENVTGSQGNDYIIGDSLANVLDGQDGNDLLIGGSDNDTIIGGLGNDQLNGDSGNDVYIFNRGDGQDYIDEDGGTDQLILDGYSPDEVTVRRSALNESTSRDESDDLVITFAGTNDQITVLNGLFEGPSAHTIEEIVFSDGTIWTLADIREMVANQTLPADDQTITGTSSDDTLEGGAGDDVLSGFQGDDTYVFNRGDGRDSIEENGDSAQTLVGDTLEINGYSLAEISFERVGRDSDDLVIRFTGSDDQITIHNQLGGFGLTNSFADRIEEIVLDDGTRLNADEISALVLEGEATSGNDVLFGTNINDTLAGGAGNDFLSGSGGTDTYVFARGDGEDVILPNRFGDDDIVVINGYTPDDLSFARLTTERNDLVITFNGTEDRLIIRETLAQSTNPQEIARIEFDNGEVLTLNDIFPLIVEGGQTSGADIINGFASTNDTIEGGLGNDTLSGRGGADTYIFNRGDGEDLIEDNGQAGSIDRLVFSDYDQADVIFAQASSGSATLIITFVGTNDRIEVINGLSDTPNNSAGRDQVEEYQFADGTVLTAAEIRANITTGTDAADTVTGFQSADVITGGAGNDTLIGNDGADTYIFNAGDGQDIIEDNGIGETDRVILSDYTADQTSFAIDPANSSNLIISFEGSSDTITILNTLVNDRDDTVEIIEFADGSTATIEDILAQFVASEATDGDDIINGFVTSDNLEGGLGNDTISGGDGSDTYTFNAGDGQDVIEDNGIGDTDRLRITGYSLDQISFERDIDNSQSLVITFDGSGDQITLVNTLSGTSEDLIEEIIFDDGTVLGPDDINDILAQADAGTDDLITGTTGADTLEGGRGNDTLNGGGNSDTYIFNAGDGQDVIEDNGSRSNDRVVVGYSIDDVVFGRTASTSDDLVLTFNGSDDQITVFNTLNNSSQDIIEQFEFADGTVLSTQDVRDRVLAASVTDGDDNIVGFTTNDRIEGGLGDDTLTGGGGSDTYIFNVGDGSDVVDDNGSRSNDRIVLGYSIDDVIFGRATETSNDLVLNFVNSTDQITVRNALGNSSQDGIEQFEFADGTILSANDIRSRVLEALATEGNDSIVGFISSDTIEAGPGDDTIIGGGGSDTYVFNRGDGEDVIEDNGNNSTDTIEIRGYLPTQVVITRTDPHSDDLLLEFIEGPGSGDEDDFEALATLLFNGELERATDSIVAINALSNSSQDRIERIQFEDGTTLSIADIRARVLAVSATGGDDNFSGFSSADTLVGGRGDDTLSGRGGSDTYEFSVGDGDDVIDDNGFGSTDQLIIHGVNPGAISIQLESMGSNNVVLTFGGGRITLLNNVTNNSADVIERIVFDDGTILTRTDILARLSEGTDIDDQIFGTNAGETFSGGSGNDFIDAGEGDDLLNGGLGDDTLVGNLGDDTLDGGDGIDTADYSFSIRGGVFDLTTGSATIAGETSEAIINIENIIGSAGDDQIMGDDSVNVLEGGMGNDTLTGGAGADIFRFGTGFGNDQITDFEDGIDLLDFSDSGLTFSDLTIAANGSDTTVTDVNGNTIVLLGITTPVTEADFLF